MIGVSPDTECEVERLIDEGVQSLPVVLVH